MTKYSVHKGIGDNRVVIALDGYGPPESQGFKSVGTFDHGVDPESGATSAQSLNDTSGDHFFVAKAKELLRETGDYNHVNLDALTYLDQASNAPLEEHSQVTSTESLRDSGGDPDPDISTQLGGVGSEQNHSEAPTTQNSETELVENNQGGPAQERIIEPEAAIEQSTGQQEGHSENEQAEGEAEEDEDADHDGETIPELTERISTITDKAELEGIYTEEQQRQPKARKGALAAIEARATELNQPAE